MNNPVTTPSPRPASEGRLRYILAAALFLIAGCTAIVWQVQRADRHLRDVLQEDAQLLAGALHSQDIATLTGTEADLDSAIYQRVKRGLAHARALMPHGKFVYLMSRDDEGTVRFLVDSEPPDSEDYSPPGQPYPEATDTLLQVFSKRRPAVEGPVEDRWGVWISALLPLVAPQNGRLIAVLGVDVDASHWRGILARIALPPTVFTAAMLACIGLLMARRHRTSADPKPRIGGAGIVAVSGLLFTILLALLAHEEEKWARQHAFRRAALERVDSLQQQLKSIGTRDLEGIARLFDSSNFVDANEFRAYVGFLLSHPHIAAWKWSPAVAPADVDTFVQAVRENGPIDFALRPLRESLPTPVLHFPVCYIEPTEGHAADFGVDLASDPDLQAVLDEAFRTGQVVAAPPRPATVWPHLPGATIVLRPVWNRDGSGRLAGVASCILLPEHLLRHAFRTMDGDETPLLMATLEHTDGKAPPQRIAATPAAIAPGEPDGPFTLRAPAFVFGQTFVTRVDAGPLFHQLYPARAGLRTLLIGLVLSALVAALYRAMQARRQALETEVQERTAALWQSEQSYRRLFNTITQAIYILDDQLRYIDVNEGACAMYDYRREEFIGRGIDFLDAPGRNQHLDIHAIIARVMAGETVYLEYWGRRKNGEEFPKELWVTRGTYFGSDVFIVVANEISDRKKGEAERERLHAQIVQAQKMESVGRLAGGVAHDFNNMLQAIIGNALLARQQIDAHHPSHELLAEIEASAQRSAALTRQLLAFASRQTIQPRVVDLNTIVTSILKMLHRLIGENIHLEWKPASGLWPVKIDPGQIDQILANLVVNARDAIEKVGAITIATSNFTCDGTTCEQYGFECRPGSYVLLTVTDDGAGMDEETLSHVFEPFFTTKAEGKGTGLGLATVFGIVHQNHGLIAIDSRPGHGTTVKILLPRRMDDAQPEPPAAARHADATLSGSETILLVEDEPALLRMGQVALERLGYRVLAAPTPADALRIAASFEGPIDLLVTDVILPGMNGRDLALQLASLHPDTQCLFMSGYTADVISDRGVLGEQMHFLQKPFTIADLATTIRSILAARRPPSA